MKLSDREIQSFEHSRQRQLSSEATSSGLGRLLFSITNSPYSVVEVTCWMAIIFLTFVEAGSNSPKRDWLVFLIAKLVLFLLSIWSQMKIALATSVGMRGVLRVSDFTGITAKELPKSQSELVEVAIGEAAARFGDGTATVISDLWERNRRVATIGGGLAAIMMLGFVVAPRDIKTSSIFYWILALSIINGCSTIYQRNFVLGTFSQMLEAVKQALELQATPEQRVLGEPMEYRSWCLEYQINPYTFGRPPREYDTCGGSDASIS
jgi:hypothetical protein